MLNVQNTKNFTKRKKIIIDLIYNILSYGLPVFVLQFAIQPLAAFHLGSEKNGLFLTLIGVNYLITTVTAATLGKTRLLLNNKYEHMSLKGDFNYILIILSLISIFTVFIFTIIYSNSISIINLVLSIALIILFIYHDYIVVQYRIKLKFKKIFINNIILTIGYFIGFLIFRYLLYWQIIFIVPYILTAVYDYINTDFIKEPIIKTGLFNNTKRVYLLLAFSAMITSLINYVDRLVLYPLIGGSQLSIFHSASIIGKMMVILSVPISSVLLSHLTKEDNYILKIRAKYILGFILFLIFSYFATVLIGPYILKILYPLWYRESSIYLPITTATGMIVVVSTLLNVYVIRYYPTRFQIIVNSVYILVYLLISLILLYLFGLMGFVIGNLIAAVIRLAIFVYISKYKSRNAIN